MNLLKNLFQRNKLMENGRIAVPSNEKGGLDGVRAGHFGHCDVFTIIDVKDGKIENVSTIQNQAHVQGGCMVPVKMFITKLNVKKLNL